jgi:hypothetical protein
LYPLIDLLERVVLCFDREESPQQKVGKLEGFVVQYGLPLAEAVPLLAHRHEAKKVTACMVKTHSNLPVVLRWVA